MSNTAKSCKAGYYYCFTDKKCKKIPLGWHVGRGGYLSRDDDNDDSDKKNGNGDSGDGNGGSEGGNGGGQVSEEAVSNDGGSPYREYKPKPQPKPSQPPEGFDAFRKKYLNKKMNEEKHDHEHEMIRRQMDTVTSAVKRLKKKVGKRGEGNVKAWVQSKITKAADYIDTAADYMDSEVKEENIDEAGKKCWKGYKKAGTQKLFGKTYNRCVKEDETCPICNEDPCICLEGNLEEGNKSGDTSLRDWFSKSRSSDGTPGWVQLGGKYAGKPCARQPGQKTKPKCGSSKMKRNLDKDEEKAAFRRKQRQDPNPDRKGKAINVKTEEVVLENQQSNVERRNQEIQRKQIMLDRQKIDLKRKMVQVDKQANNQADKQSKPDNKMTNVKKDENLLKQLKVRESAELRYCPKCEKNETRDECSFGPKYWDTYSKPAIKEEEKKKDACYHKVKSRYSVWPSAYASGALVKCRKKGAKNWGNKSEEILAGIAAQYLFNEGVNEEGVDIFIEELGLEQFASFVEGLTADTYLIEARAARKARKGAKTYAEVKAEIDARERAKKKPSTEKTKAAAETAKKQQPKKRPVLDGIARQVLKGMERHKAAMSAARETGKTISKAAQVGAKGAKEFGKGFKSGVETAGKVSKVAYKTLNKED